jgi:hypothetical protein
MSKFTVPTFFQFLDLVIKAFHLDQDENGKKNDLRGRGRFQRFLSGRSVDLTDQKRLGLLQLFSRSLREAGVLPTLPKTVGDVLPEEPAMWAFSLGDAQPLPRITGKPDRDTAHRLSWLCKAQESMLAPARSEQTTHDLAPTFSLLPLLRFAGHHLAIALALQTWAGNLTAGQIGVESPEWSWAQETPQTTPMNLALTAANKGLGEVLRDLQARKQQGVGVVCTSDTTLDNLRNGGPGHPDLATQQALVQLLLPHDDNALPRWRRWYGLRFLARNFAAQWGWDALAAWLDDVRFVVDRLVATLSQGERRLTPEQRRACASKGLWTGWRMPWIRATLGLIVSEQGQALSPAARLDFVSIANGLEHRRFVQCFQIGASSQRLLEELAKDGLGPDACKQRALLHYRQLEGDVQDLLDRGPLFALEHAKTRNDFRGMERAARQLLAATDHPDHHFQLVLSLGYQHRFEEALAAAREGQRRHPDSEILARIEPATLMFRGHHRGSPDDFLAARALLENPRFSASWPAQLDLADCHFALGDWNETLAACAKVHQLHDESGEAYALDAICWLRMGDQKRSNHSEVNARRRGAERFLALLREHDVRGNLGSRGIVPPPRWHRVTYA